MRTLARFRRSLSRSEPSLLLMGALLTLGLAFWGFEELRAAGRLGEGAGLTDSVYQAFELFRDPAEWYQVPWQLGVARFTALAVVGFTVLHLLSNVLWSQRDRLRIRLARNHAIVCGIGEIALTAARALEDECGFVAVVAKEPTAAQVQAAREIGARIIVDDPRNSSALARAGVRRARTVMAATYDDANNIEIASTAAGLARPGVPMRCIAHVRDLRVRGTLCERELRAGMGQLCRIEFCNVYDSAARDLVSSIADEDLPMRVALVGRDPSLDAILHHLALRSRAADRGPMRAWLVRDDASVYARALRARGRLPESCKLVPVAEEVCAYPDLSCEVVCELAARQDIQDVYIAFDHDVDTVGVGRILAERLVEPRVVALVWRYVRLGRLLSGDLESSGSSGLIVHHVLGSLADGSALTSAFIELLARRIHQGWLERELARGEVVRSTPATVPWETLGADLREANFAQASQIVDALEAIGAKVVPLGVESARTPFVLTEAEVELLARREHERWMEQRRATGWRLAAERDYEARTHPSLIDYDDLSESEKQKDRDAVLDIPVLLERAGYRPTRTRGTSPRT